MTPETVLKDLEELLALRGQQLTPHEKAAVRKTLTRLAQAAYRRGFKNGSREND